MALTVKKIGDFGAANTATLGDEYIHVVQGGSSKRANLKDYIRVPEYANVSVATAMTISNASIDTIRTLGYSSPNDGGGATYKRVGTEPTHALKFSTNGGTVWWEYTPDSEGYNIRVGGAKGDGVTDDTTAIRNVIAALPNNATVIIPNGEYEISGFLDVTSNNITMIAYGAQIDANLSTTTDYAATVGQSPIIRLRGNSCRILGGTWRETGDTAQSWQIEIQGTNCKVMDAELVKTMNTGGGSSYQMYIRYGANGFEMRGCRTSGADGIFLEASDATFIGNHFKGEHPGGDDAFGIKAIQGLTANIRIIGNHLENFSMGFSVGSEVGVYNTNDSTYSRKVRGIVFEGNTLVNCTGFAFLKPGSVEPYDYRDGTVENIIISNNTLTDLGGFKFERAIALTPGRGSRIRFVRGSNNVVRARRRNASGRMAVFDAYNIDYRTVVHFESGGTASIVVGDTITGATSGVTAVVDVVTLQSGSWAAGDAVGFLNVSSKSGAFVAENINTATQTNIATIFGDPSAPLIADIEVGIEFVDPHAGAGNSASTPGFPVNYIASIENQTPTHGTMGRIRLDIDGNGAKECGILIGDGLDDAIEIKRAHLRNPSVTPSSSISGGIYSLSNVRLGDIKITELTNGYPVGSTTITNTIYTAMAEVVLLGSYGAGTGLIVDKPVWIATRDCYIHDVLLCNADDITMDATNYTTLAFINHTGSGGTFVSAGSNSISFNADVARKAHFNDCIASADAMIIPKGGVIRFTKTDSGTGQPINNMIAIIRYVPHGA